MRAVVSAMVALALALIGEAPAGAGADRLIKVAPSADAPIEVTSLTFGEASPDPDVLAEIRNSSKKDVRYVQYVLGWPDCPGQRRKPLSPIISYGSRSGPSKQPPIKPGERAILSVPGHTLKNMQRSAKKYGCSEEVRPELALMEVAFGDGTEWSPNP